MCGIVGYIGQKNALPILMEGLRRLEYRGYDSAGVALVCDKNLIVVKSAGKIKRLEEEIKDIDDMECTHGIAHTRWATHGEPNQNNAHPHTDSAEEIALIHNGIIENYRAIKEFLIQQGFKIKTDTDTEILVHLIRYNYKGDLTEAVRLALGQVEGTYGIAVVSSQNPDVIVAARMGSPLVVGHGDGENFVASDVSAILEHTKKVVYLEDGEIATVSAESYKITTIENDKITPQIEEVTWNLDQIEKAGYEHFMLKEIEEQPATLRNAFRGRLNYDDGIPRLDGLNLQAEELRNIKRT